MSDLASSAHKLEPFVLMSKSAKGAAAAKLIENATSAPGVFVFGELLEQPNIQELAGNPAQAPYLELLKLFSYGTYEEWKQHKDALPPLGPAQLTKLKYLSLVSLGKKSRILPYAQLRAYLDMSTIRELEDLIIDAMYQDILRARLDQKEQQLEIEYTMGRDIRPGELEELLAALKSWSNQTSQVIAALDSKISQIEGHHAQQKADAEVYNEHRSALILDIAIQKKLSKSQNRMPNMLGDSDEMDVDPTSPPPTYGHSGRGPGMGMLMGMVKKSGSTSTSSGAPASPNTRKRNRN